MVYAYEILFAHFPGPRKHSPAINEAIQDDPSDFTVITVLADITMGPKMLITVWLGILLCIAGKDHHFGVLISLPSATISVFFFI